jgi:hypothetical protein
MLDLYLLVGFLVCVICGIAAAFIADQRGGSGPGWFFLGFFFGPIGFIMSFAEGSRCSECRSSISNAAVVCRFCGYRRTRQYPAAYVPPAIPNDTEKPVLTAPAAGGISSRSRHFIVVVLTVAGVIGLIMLSINASKP